MYYVFELLVNRKIFNENYLCLTEYGLFPTMTSLNMLLYYNTYMRPVDFIIVGGGDLLGFLRIS